MHDKGINRRAVLRCFLAVTGGVLAPMDVRAAVGVRVAF
jgi:hypothetical protein